MIEDTVRDSDDLSRHLDLLSCKELQHRGTETTRGDILFDGDDTAGLTGKPQDEILVERFDEAGIHHGRVDPLDPREPQPRVRL